MNVLTETQLLYEHHELLDWLDDDEIKQSQDDGYIQDLFSCDPDYIFDGENKLPFVIINGMVIIPELWEYDDPNNEGIEEALGEFISDGFKNYFQEIKSSWENFESKKFNIAYRGGAGYTYSIWEYQK